MAAETGQGYLMKVVRSGARPFFAPARRGGRVAYAPPTSEPHAPVTRPTPSAPSESTPNAPFDGSAALPPPSGREVTSTREEETPRAVMTSDASADVPSLDAPSPSDLSSTLGVVESGSEAESADHSDPADVADGGESVQPAEPALRREASALRQKEVAREDAQKEPRAEEQARQAAPGERGENVRRQAEATSPLLQHTPGETIVRLPRLPVRPGGVPRPEQRPVSLSEVREELEDLHATAAESTGAVPGADAQPQPRDAARQAEAGGADAEAIPDSASKTSGSPGGISRASHFGTAEMLTDGTAETHPSGDSTLRPGAGSWANPASREKISHPKAETTQAGRPTRGHESAQNILSPPTAASPPPAAGKRVAPGEPKVPGQSTRPEHQLRVDDTPPLSSPTRATNADTSGGAHAHVAATPAHTVATPAHGATTPMHAATVNAPTPAAQAHGTVPHSPTPLPRTPTSATHVRAESTPAPTAVTSGQSEASSPAPSRAGVVVGGGRDGGARGSGRPGVGETAGLFPAESKRPRVGEARSGRESAAGGGAAKVTVGRLDVRVVNQTPPAPPPAPKPPAPAPKRDGWESLDRGLLGRLFLL